MVDCCRGRWQSAPGASGSSHNLAPAITIFKKSMPSTTISVLGLGNWGTALANHLATKGFDVLGWCKEKEIFDGINSKHENPTYLKGIALSPQLKATLNLEEALGAKYILLVFSASALREMSAKLRVSNDTLLISCIKGLESTTLLTPLKFLEANLVSKPALAVVSGPTFARDIVAHRPSGAVAASKNEAVAREVAELFNSDWMKLYVSTDPLGVELGGILKNVIALAAGVCDGLKLGDSARAGLITRGLAEMMRISQAMGADLQTLSGLSGLGDLIMTATSDLSRNRTVGVRLGKGEKLADIIRSLGSVAEGVSSTPVILELAKRNSVDVPIIDAVSKLLKDEVTAMEMVQALLKRPMRREF